MLPIYQEYNIPINNDDYTKEDIIMQTSFNKGKYANSMEVPKVKGNEYQGEPPAYFVSSSLGDEYRGWYGNDGNLI